MARKTTTLQPAVVPLAIRRNRPEKPEIQPTVLEERQKLIGMFNDAAFQKAWHNAEMCKPTLFPEGLDGEHGGQIANNRLHQLQGWEMHKIALLRQVDDPKIPHVPLAETYPDPTKT